MAILEEIRDRHARDGVPGQDPYGPGSQGRQGADIDWLLYEVDRLSDALQAQVDDAVDEPDVRYWAQLVLDDRWTRDEGECPAPTFVVTKS